MDVILTQTFIVGLIASAFRLSTPVLLAALGETFSECSGIMNVGVEGVMLMGVLGGFMGAYFTGNPWVGALTGMLAGTALSLIHAYVTITLAADQVISGVALNILAFGLAIFTNRAIFGIPTREIIAPVFQAIYLPGLSDIPFLGGILFSHHVFVYITALILVPLAYVLLFKTTLGLKIRAVGEDPAAAETAGINVYKVRYLSVLLGGALAGLGGMVLTLGQLGFFKENLVAGRGFIAIAVVMFGRWNPLGVLGTALLFGVADAFQLRLQNVPGLRFIPEQLFVALPYLLTILVVLAGTTKGGRSMMPKALCVPYIRQDKG